MRIYAQQGRICSKIFTQLYSASASRKTADEIIASINEVDRDLTRWRDSIPLLIRPGQPIIRSKLPASMVGTYGIVLHMMYWHMLCMTHRMSTQYSSWLHTAAEQPLISSKKLDDHLSQVKSSTQLVTESARTVVMLTKHLDIESFTPSWYHNFSCL